MSENYDLLDQKTVREDTGDDDIELGNINLYDKTRQQTFL